MTKKTKNYEHDETTENTGADGVLILEAKVAALESELEIAAIKLIEERGVAERYKDDYLRLRAEFDNFRRRSADSAARAHAEAVSETAEKYLEVADVVERALEMITDRNTRVGVEMIAQKLAAIFASQGITEIEALGKLFDPELHDAAETVDADNPEHDQLIVGVLLKGYITDDGRVIRHSVVRVARCVQ